MQQLNPSEISDIIKQRKKLAAAECYDDVIKLHNRLANGKKLEEQQWLDNIKQRQATGRAAARAPPYRGTSK